MSTLTIEPAFQAQNRGSPPTQLSREEEIRLQIGAFCSYQQLGGLAGIPVRIYAVTIGSGTVNRIFKEVTVATFDFPVLTISGLPGDNGPATEAISNIVKFQYIPLS